MQTHTPARRARWKTPAFVTALWLSWLLLETGFELLRGIGDEVSPIRRVGWVESALFFGEWPSVTLQRWLFERDLAWLDYLTYLIHGLWFGVPFAFGGIITFYRRDLLMEFFAWMVVGAYISAAFFVFMPVAPPWMEGDVPRVLLVRNFGDYTGIDPNPAAAFPSLHVALPAALGLFFLLRCPKKLHLYGKVLLGYSLLVAFAVVYMGEHWAIDVLASYVLAGLVAFLFTNRMVRRIAGAVPGDPVGRLVALNTRMLPPPAPRKRRTPVPLPVTDPGHREAA